MCLWYMYSPRDKKVKIKSYIKTLSHPQGHVMSVKCEQPLDELTPRVWLLYHHLNFKYCTLFKWDEITYRPEVPQSSEAGLP